MANRLNGIVRAYQYQNGYFGWTQNHHIDPITCECWQWAPELVPFAKCFHQVGILSTRLRNYTMEIEQNKQNFRGKKSVCSGWTFIRNSILPTVPSSAKHKAPEQIKNQLELLHRNSNYERVPLSGTWIRTLPSSDMIPHRNQTVRQSPMLPEYFKAAVGDMNMPDPIMTPIMILTDDKRPMFRCSPTCSDFSSPAAAVVIRKIEQPIK